MQANHEEVTVMVGMNDRTAELPGVGRTRAAALAKLGILTARDLLYHFPRGYQDRGNILSLLGCPDGTVGAFILTVASAPSSARISGGRYLTKFSAYDDSASVGIVYFNQPYVRDIFRVGATFRFWGRLSYSGGRAQLISPLFEPVLPGKPLPALVPVYPLTAGISSKLISGLVKSLLDSGCLCERDDIIPIATRRELGLPDLADAMRMLHLPQNGDEVKKAMRRFTFERMLTFALCAGLSKQSLDSRRHFQIAQADLEPFYSLLPFEPTGAQRRAIADIGRDMCADASAPPMSRILTGDVGSGKTVVAAAAIFTAAQSCIQSAMMAPTEILAQQHYRELEPLLGQAGIKVGLITGSTPKKQRAATEEQLRTGELDAVIGTHALLSEDVVFHRLGLVITDEQHRFGVMQRTALSEKSGAAAPSPHVLVMSATPIPRTLSFILYGDLAISTLDELPPGRQKIDTFAVGESYRERLDAFIRKTVLAGHRVYVVCPAVSPAEAKADTEDEQLGDGEDQRQLHTATETAQRLASLFPDIPVGLVYGKMKSADKERAMADFAEGRTSILVSTTVIEVGVNVPEATLMIIEDADRFGLSQLHQLRGRVGRGSEKSYCVLVSDNRSNEARSRLEIMVRSNDGFAIAQRDLQLRGPGDFFPHAGGGARQHGAVDSELFSVGADEQAVEQASRTAKELLDADPMLAGHPALRERVEQLMTVGINTIH